MKSFIAASPLALCAGLFIFGAAPAFAGETHAEGEADAEARAVAAFDLAAAGAAAQRSLRNSPISRQARRARPCGSGRRSRPCLTRTGRPSALVPGWCRPMRGSDNFQFFPLPLIVGRVGGVGFRPAAAGLTLDFLSPQPTLVSRKKTPTVSLGPTFRFRNDRAVDSGDDVVNAAGRLDKCARSRTQCRSQLSRDIEPLRSR